MGTAKVVVVGGGVVGVCCAYWLRLRGADVTLLERDRLASGASSGNAGTVSAGHPPLNKPGRLPQALKQLADPTGPLYIQPRWDPELLRWLADFALHCTEDHVQACMEVMAPWGMEALRLFDEVVAEEQLACGYRREGYFDVCRTDRALEGAKHEADTVRTYGYHPDLVDGDTLRRTEPALAGDVLGGVFYPEAATLNPHHFVMELADRAKRRGIDIREGEGVAEVLLSSGKAAGVRTTGGERVPADVVVLATGPFSLELARRLGSRLPVQPGKGYHRDMLVGDRAAPPLRIACVLNETSVFCTPMEGFVRFAGTMEFSGLNHDMRRDRLEQLSRSARRYLPTLGDAAPLSEWCGLRPMASDGLPIVGPLAGVDGVVVATGHGMLGLTLGPATGSLVADYVLDGRVAPRWKPLSPERFA
jgi:D-amino-acid dehydrogenase